MHSDLATIQTQVRQRATVWCLLIVASLSALTGCSSAVVVGSKFPTPLVETLPVRVGLIFNDELYDYIHTESLPRQSTWTIDLGDANVAMLQPLFETMFAETHTIDSLPNELVEQQRFDGVLQPVLEKFEFDIPFGERDQFVEVWMQYKLTLFRPNGEIIIEWPVTGYGKYELSGNRVDAVERAAIVAMREAGATISTKFTELPDVTYWLEENHNEARSPNAAVLN